jgi:hypothetical protein
MPMKPVSSSYPGEPFQVMVLLQYFNGSAVPDHMTIEIIGAGGLFLYE